MESYFMIWLFLVGIVANTYFAWKVGRILARFLLTVLPLTYSTLRMIRQEVVEGKKLYPEAKVEWKTMHKAFRDRYKMLLMQEVLCHTFISARVTCKAKGGLYDQLGVATGAGTSRGKGVVVYRDTKTKQLFYRELDDYFERMEVAAVLYM